MREAVTITAGSVIGVGLFTTGSNVVGTLGPAVILATLLALAVSIYPALLYAEMGAALPYAGGTYQFASLGLGRAAGMLAGWNFIISLVASDGGRSARFQLLLPNAFPRVWLRPADIRRGARLHCDRGLHCGQCFRREAHRKTAERLHVLLLGRRLHLVPYDDSECPPAVLCAGSGIPSRDNTSRILLRDLHDLVVLCWV